MQGGRLFESVAFDAYTQTDDGYGGLIEAWTQQHACRAEFVYNRGSEEVDAARLSGVSIYKIKVRSCVAARAITAEYRMRDARRSITYNIREVDVVSDRKWVYLVCESGVSA